ncbi:hypothetical protein BDZ97DRAFT_1659464, partial [Flammula alnicola]
LCYYGGVDKTVTCIDAYGTTESAYPSATTGVVPSATPVLGNDTRFVYAPSHAWNISKTDANCTLTNLLHTTDTLNATISFNYSGPSVTMHVVTAPNGGVFSVVVDGFNTWSTIETFSGTSDQPFPLCYQYQFPPFVITPPGFASRENHSLTLVFIGPSNSLPANTSKSIGQFNAFAIPDFVYPTISTTSENYASSFFPKYRYLWVIHLSFAGIVFPHLVNKIVHRIKSFPRFT